MLNQNYSVHCYSKTCCKYQNKNCRFSYEKFFISNTIIIEPLPDELTCDVKSEIMKHRKPFLQKVNNYIDTELNPAKTIITSSDMSMKN